MANFSLSAGSKIQSTAVYNCHVVAYGLRLKDPALSETIASICFVLSIITIIFNALVLKTFYGRRRRIKTNEVIIVGLACTDVFTGAFSFPAHGIMNLKLAAKTESCPLIIATMMCSHCGQLLTISSLILASFDRYFAIFQPYFYDNKCKNYYIAIKILIGVWISCVTISSVDILGVRNFMLYRVAFLSQIAFIVPFAIILHIKAYLTVRQIDQRVQSQGEVENTEGRRKNAKAVRITATIIAAMCLCYFPQLLALIHRGKFKTGTHNVDTANVIVMSTTVLAMFNSTINPIIYCFQMNSFRNDLRRLFLGQQSSNTRDTDNKVTSTECVTLPRDS